MPKHFDAIIIGAGQAGPTLAGRLTQAGRTVAYVERKLFGGTCVNTGCTPTKAMVASAYVAQKARTRRGLRSSRRPHLGRHEGRQSPQRQDRPQLPHWTSKAICAICPRCTVFNGHARFESPKEVRVNDDLLSADEIFINVGGRAVVPDFPGVNEVPYLTNVGILDLDTLPRHLVIIGGSYVGLEFAQIFRRFGSEVTVIEKGPRLVHREDEDVSATIRSFLEKEGIKVRTSAECIHFRREGNDIAAGVSCTDDPSESIGSHVLLAVGRRPNTDDLGLEKAGIAQDEHGFITVDDQLRTSVPGIWAIGDCNGRGAFTHTAWNDYEIVAANLLDNDPRRVTDRIPCYALYTDPPLGRVGLTETEVRKSGKPALIGIRPMTRVGRAVEKGETEGFIKILVDATTKQILGANILGTGGDEAIHCILDTCTRRPPTPACERAVHIHPTVSELLPTVLGDLKPLT